VAAHLEADILIVDEVLALGDVEFQKKCLGQMHDVSKGGRTVLFVSHNMSTIMTLCSRAILLDHGVLKLDSSANETVESYLRQYTGLESFDRGMNQADKVKIVSGRFARMTDKNGFRRSVELRVWSDADRRVGLDLRVSEGTGVPVGFGSLGTFTSADLVEVRRGMTMIMVSFPTEFLANGTYALSFDVTIPFREYFDRAERCLSFGLERSAPIGQSHVATQNWGYGSLEIPVYLDQLTRLSN
jgi:lipopolysaccharide transport system ATP-binding protein